MKIVPTIIRCVGIVSLAVFGGLVCKAAEISQWYNILLYAGVIVYVAGNDLEGHM